jgi:hypothetical protein
VRTRRIRGNLAAGPVDLDLRLDVYRHVVIVDPSPVGFTYSIPLRILKDFKTLISKLWFTPVKRLVSRQTVVFKRRLHKLDSIRRTLEFAGETEFAHPTGTGWPDVGLGTWSAVATVTTVG